MKTKKTYNVVCPFNDSHRFPLVIEFKDSKPLEKDKSMTMQVYCPWCKDYLQVEVKGEAEHDKAVYKKTLGLTDEDLEL